MTGKTSLSPSGKSLQCGAFHPLLSGLRCNGAGAELLSVKPEIPDLRNEQHQDRTISQERTPGRQRGHPIGHLITHGVGTRRMREPPDTIDREEDAPGGYHREDERPGLAMLAQMQPGNHQGEQKHSCQERLQEVIVDQEPCPPSAERKPTRAGNPEQHSVVTKDASAANALPLPRRTKGCCLSIHVSFSKERVIPIEHKPVVLSSSHRSSFPWI